MKIYLYVSGREFLITQNFDDYHKGASNWIDFGYMSYPYYIEKHLTLQNLLKGE